MTTIDVNMVREALADLPDETSYGESLKPEHVYLPRSHLKATDPNILIVTGMRGAGKTFWWSALQNSTVRQLVGQSAGQSSLSAATEARTGFGVPPRDDYPSRDILQALMNDGVDPRIIWRTVQARQLAHESHPLRQQNTWAERVCYVSNHIEAIELLFRERDDEFNKQGVYCLILFDALDRCADDWQDMYRMIRGLLQTALDMRAYQRLRVKVFLRSDQIDETKVADFPDASKVLSSAVELNWPSHELYGLLWHYLANGPNGADFRKFLTADDWQFAKAGEQRVFPIPQSSDDWQSVKAGEQRVFSVPRSLISRGEYQREKFHVIAGPWMGRGPKRGFPYTWIPNHLADTEGRVSPRSFIAALKTAAENTADWHPDHNHSLHYDSIKRGVQEASKIRVREIQEDYPWVHQLLSPLEGMVVPCKFDEIAKCWQQKDVLDDLINAVKQGEVKLPPLHIKQGSDGVREDLESLGVFFRMRDGRVNIPDVFRVGYGLGRRGGVRPVR